MGLVSSSDYDELPLEPTQRWLKLRDLVESRLASATDHQNGPAEEDLIEYCTILVSAAKSLGLADMDDVSVGEINQNFKYVRAQIIGLATKLSVGMIPARAAYSVSLSAPNKVKIIREIERLRGVVENSDLYEKQKRKLQAKLDELNAIVVSNRVDYAKLMAIIAYFSAGVVNSTAFLSDAPNAIATITSIVGMAKEEEEDDNLLIERSRAQLQIEDKRSLSKNSDESPI